MNLDHLEITTIRRLTERQLHILRLAATQRLTQTEIADALGISRSTVETHYRRALRKLNHHNERKCW
jgi:two-component system, NarL family, invasion response regulator UvrY